MRKLIFASFLTFIACLCYEAQASDADVLPKGRVTILYDAFGTNDRLKQDWGYSAFIEYGGKRILFDTGNNADILKNNVNSLGIDLKKLDFVVISHRHGDHTSGLSYVLKQNPGVRIYTPTEVSGFGTPVLPGIMKGINHHDPRLPSSMHYFNGTHQEDRPSGSPWPEAHFIQIEKTTEVAPGFYVLSTISDVSGTKEMHEISLTFRTPLGLVLVAGCSHPGIEKIVKEAQNIDPQIFTVFGGLHLISNPEQEVHRIANCLHREFGIQRMAVGHCTGIPAFAALKRLYLDKYDYAGVGSTIELP